MTLLNLHLVPIIFKRIIFSDSGFDPTVVLSSRASLSFKKKGEGN